MAALLVVVLLRNIIEVIKVAVSSNPRKAHLHMLLLEARAVNFKVGVVLHPSMAEQGLYLQLLHKLVGCCRNLLWQVLANKQLRKFLVTALLFALVELAVSSNPRKAAVNSKCRKQVDRSPSEQVMGMRAVSFRLNRQGQKISEVERLG